ncbi:MAG: helix-turn-helix transcriptional regulator [Firmicutes bacterium]|nr:helix-turn-helix transcriptional regulator [Bacillota bacterium]
MELGKRLKECRAKSEMTQEELADKLYVSRQTISSWENDKSYPDIHSLLMISDLFGVSLDSLIKGDIEIMKEKVEQTKIKSFQRDSNIFAVLIIVCIVSALPLYKWLGIPGGAIWLIIAGAMIYFAFRVEKVKKEEDIHTYKEIVAFMNGEKLDGIEKAREEGKRHYEPIIKLLAGAVVGVIVAMILSRFM